MEFKGLLTYGCPTIDEIAEGFSRTFYVIIVFNITKSGDFISHFLCNILENAHQACKTQKMCVASNATELKRNVASPLDYDTLATDTSTKGCLDFNLTRSSVIRKIKGHHENILGLKVTDLSMTCPSKLHLV